MFETESGKQASSKTRGLGDVYKKQDHLHRGAVPEEHEGVGFGGWRAKYVYAQVHKRAFSRLKVYILYSAR